MRKGFKPMYGAAGWQLSNAQIFSFAAHKASLDLFKEASMPVLRQKSEKLTGYLEFLLRQMDKGFKILTPSEPAARGCQLSIFTPRNGKKLFDYLAGNGVVSDWREDNLSGMATAPGEAGVIRVAPVPLYNTFEDVYRFANLLDNA
jgi:kynureninase